MRHLVIQIRNGPLDLAQRFANRTGDIMCDSAGELSALRHDASGGTKDLAYEFRDLLPHVLRKSLREVFEWPREAMAEAKFAGTAATVVVARMLIVGEQDDVGAGCFEADIESARAERALDQLRG